MAKQTPDNQIPDVIKVPNVIASGARWLFGQEANTVALFVLIGMVGAGFRYGVPYLLETGRDMHKEIVDTHREDRKSAWERVNKVGEVLDRQTKSVDSATRAVEALVVELKEERRRDRPAKGNP